MTRYLNRWFVLFAILMAYWHIEESMQPGQQYADPLWPCVYCTSFFMLCWLTGRAWADVIIKVVTR